MRRSGQQWPILVFQNGTLLLLVVCSSLCHHRCVIACDKNNNPVHPTQGVHGSLTLQEIENFIRPIFTLAYKLQEIETDANIREPLTVTIFFDELNTCHCQCLFKEMIIDR